MIEDERMRQKRRRPEGEGYTHVHDDQHRRCELRKAAECYLLVPALRVFRERQGRLVPVGWPWDAEWWKPSPKDRVRELVKAGALIAAEIDRLQRRSDG